MNLIENEVLNKIISSVDKKYFDTTKIDLKENGESSSYNSIVIVSKPTVYRQTVSSEVLLCRIKAKGKNTYISFPPTFKSIIDKLGFIYSNTESDKFLRIELEQFLSCDNNELFSRVMNEIFLKSFNFPRFGCCSRYKECSKEKKCVHPDLIYATACEYRKNLENGKIFY